MTSAPRPAPRRRARTPSAARPARSRRGLPAGFEREEAPLGRGVLLRARTPAGTPVLVRPMPGFAKRYAMLAARFGSLDTALPDGTPLPAGLAHFLEHKMFETPEGDAFDLYARRGAAANAYTTFGHTAYLFSCTSRFEENLVTLIETLLALRAEPKGIEREKGIIGQEIAMYDDDAGWRSHFDLLAALYRDHPIRVEVTGTKESIAPIDRSVLERTHAAYYHPANLVLCVAGDVDPSRVLAVASERLVARVPGRAHRRAPVAEPLAPARPETRRALSVSRPLVSLGLKDEPAGEDLDRRLARDAETEMLLDAVFGDGGRVQAPLYREGLVDGSFAASWESGADYAFATVSAEVDEEAPYRRRLEELLEAAATAPFARAEADRARRRAVGGLLRSFNAPDRLAGLHLALEVDGVTLGRAYAAVEAVTPARMDARLRDLLGRGRAWCVVEPKARLA